MNRNNENIVFFDGFCGLCSDFVDFVLKVDKKSQFKFSPLQSDFAQKNLPVSLTRDLSTVAIIIDGKIYLKAPAVLLLFQRLGGFWWVLSLLRFLPKAFLNFFYDLIAKHRYLILPKRDTCRLPTPAERERFIS